MAQKTIFAVEDDDIFAAYLETALTDLGYAVLGPVATGEDAIAQARANKPDLILMDIDLAGEMDGIAAADHIKSFLDVPIIYLTGHSEPSFLRQAGITAPYGYLVKPVSRQELATTIEMALYRHALDMKLKASEQRFRSLFETSRDSILLINHETVQIVGANPAACKLYGYSPEEFAALKITDVSAEPEKTEAAVRQSVPGVPFRLHRKKDGTVFPVEISRGYLEEGDLHIEAAFIRDITERKKAEEQLLIANFGIQSSISAIRFADLDGRVTSVNDSFVRLWGYERADEVVGRHISELAMSGMEAEGIKALRSGRGYIGESRAKRKDGSSFDVQVAVSVVKTDEGKPICTMASFIDITERKQAEEKLLTSQLQLTEAADLARIAHWERDGATDEFIFNDAFYELYGTTAEREDGYRMPRDEYLKRFVHPDDLEELRRQVDENRARPRTDDFDQYEHRAIRRDGEAIHILSRSRVTAVSEGRILKVVGVNQDITKRKHAEEKTEHLASYPQLNPDPIIEVDISGKITFFNPSAQALLEKFGLDIGDPKSLLPGDLDAILRDWDKKSESTLCREMSLSDRIFAEIVHLLPQFSVARVYAHDITDRKQAEETLRTSQLQLAEAADQARIAYWEYDGATDDFTFNDAFYELYGTTAEQEGGYRMAREEFYRRFVHPADVEELRRRVDENRAHPRAGALGQYELRVVRRDGEVLHILNRSRVITVSEGRVAKEVGVNQDITARKEMENALREYEKVIEGSPDMMTVVDRDYRHRVANSAFLKRRGLDREDVIGRSVSDLAGKNVFEQTFKEHLDRCFGGDPVQYEMKYSFPEPGERDLLVSYLPIQGPEGIDRVASIMRDVTESKKTHEALKKSERKYQTLFDTMSDGFASVDMDKRIVEANPAYLGMVGYTEDEILTMTYEDITPQKWHSLEEHIIQEQVLTRGYSDAYVKEYVRKDGTVFPVEIRSHLLRDKEGHPSGMWAFFRDVTDRVDAEKALRQSEERFATVFRAGPIGASLTRLADGKFLDVNDAFLRLFGYEHSEVIGSDPLSLGMWVNADHRSRMMDTLRERGRVRDFETTFRTKIGEAREVLVVSKLVDVAQERYILGLALDITDRKKAEDALRESETKLRAILDSSRDAIGVSKNGIHTFANPAYVSLFGYESDDELMSTPIIDRIAPESRALIEERVKKRAASEPVPSFYEVSACKKDGTTFLAEASVSTYVLKGERYLLVVMRDITERKKAEAEFRLLKHSIDVHYDGAYWLNSNNEFVYINEAACKSLGYGREELIGKTIYDITPTRIPETMKEVWEGLRKGGSFLRESVHRRKDGSEFPVELLATYVQFGDKEYACGFARDISEKKRLEEQLRQAQKMEAVGTLAGGVAHDFNNILTVIMGLGNLMQMEIDKDDIHKAYVDQIVTSSERAADLTQSLLAFSRKQRITLEPHKVNGVVTSTAKLLTRLLPEDIKLSINLTDRDTPSLLDVTQIGQVLMNLATNARDAMPHGGSLTITTKRAKIDETFTKTHGFGRRGDYVRLSVSDTGTGMDEETLSRIFEPFFTTKEVGKGTGLGLASAYGIVKQHKGYITVSSRLFEGTTFDIYLPLIRTPSRKKARATGKTKGGAETILIVEDDRDVRNMLTKILENEGYTTIEAIDGNDAISVHHEHKEHIDLIILDVVMPGKNGKEAFDEITRANPLAKAIFVSGYTGDIVIDKGIHSENVDFLQKPLSVTALLAKVREVLDR